MFLSGKIFRRIGVTSVNTLHNAITFTINICENKQQKVARKHTCRKQSDLLSHNYTNQANNMNTFDRYLLYFLLLDSIGINYC